MIYNPQNYAIEDERMKPFIDENEIWDFINKTNNPTKERVREVIQKSLDKNRLSLEETAILINAKDPELIEEIKKGAQELKEKVYGKRIVLFAPLYVGNYCTNNCKYCGFRTTNRKQVRTTLTDQQLIQEVEALEENGQKRLILVYGEHPKYNAEFIANSVKTVYQVKKGNGEIRRVNINAAPLEIEDYKIVHEAGIGTYQIFQETYHKDTYKSVHLSGKKADYDYRLTGLDRAQEAGIDDVGIGALFGLYDWRFELMALVRHVNHFEACYNVGPHTISFPRIKDASEYDIVDKYRVSDEDFTRLVAIIRLAVPYTGLILTAREPVEIRQEIMSFGVSQIDGGTKIEMGTYSKKNGENQDLDKEQFKINDNRSLGEVIDELLEKDYIPSFCTACYRTGRTGEHFMEFSVPGFIKKYCTPNALLTLAEYIEDYATDEVRAKGELVIEKNLAEMDDEKVKQRLVERLAKVKAGERDLYF